MPRKFQGRNPPMARRRWRSVSSIVGAASCLIALSLLGASGCNDAATKAVPVTPSKSMRPILRGDIHSLARREEIRTRAGQGGAEVVLLGDSIMEAWGWAGLPVLRRAFGERPVANLGVSGDRTENVLARVEGDLVGFDPLVVVLLIGTNNLGHDPASDVVGGIGAIVESLRVLRPDAEILLLALLPRGFEADSPEREAVRTVNRLLEREARDWPVTWLDVGDALVEPDGRLRLDVSDDGLHFRELGYTRWWGAMQPTVDRLLRKPGAPDRS